VSAHGDVLSWAQRVIAKKSAPPNQILELPSTATFEHAQAAFHEIARTAHPDLHRNFVTPDELASITRAYSIAAGAYQAYRSRPSETSRPPASASKPGPQSQMSPRALVYYRKAELALRRGDLAGAVLQLKMAIATDPQSTFLRTALSEVEAGIRKPPSD
jgi:hypothetical protein